MRLTPELTALPYDRGRVTPGIVHLGVGAFFRAHGAVYLDSLLAADPSWGVIGVSLRRPDTRDALAPQGFCYTVAVRSGTGTDCRAIGAILDVLDATTQLDAVLRAMCDPGCRIVTLTVTEKGYCHDPAVGLLNAGHPDILHDLAEPGRPRSVPGLIVRAIEQRRAVGLAPFTVLCCDNLPANGRTVAAVVGGFADLRGGDLGGFVRSRVAFPSTMVDRIVPATTDADREMVAREAGWTDAWPVVTEPFSQWVIEDRFPTGRPDFGSAGAQMVEDVHDFELMKLRMLNGSHSTLAYLGYLAGYETVSETVANPDFSGLVQAMMQDEIAPTLPPGLGDVGAYSADLIRRFANPALRHRTWQIAMDGSQKLPQRLLGTVRDRLRAGRSVDRLALGVAAWMRYVAGVDEAGRKIDVRDPLAGRLGAIFETTGRDPAALARAYLSVGEVFGADLPASARFSDPVTRHLAALFRQGSARTVADIQAAQSS